MAFPRRLLLEGESVALDLRPHWWFFAGPVAAGVPVAGVLAGVWRLSGDVQAAGLYGFAVLALAWAGWLGARLARWAGTHFVVTSDRIIFRTGVLSRRRRDIPLGRINDITSHQTLLERIVGAGDLLVEPAGEGGRQVFRDIADPDAVQREIHRWMEARAARARPGPGTWPSVPAQMASLADLRDRGAISDADYEAKKAELLGRM